MKISVQAKQRKKLNVNVFVSKQLGLTAILDYIR
jgi:hypothetical protein